MTGETKEAKGWETTNVTNLLKSGESGVYYGRVKSNGKQKWRSLKTTSFSVAKLKLADFEKEVRAQGLAEDGDETGVRETSVARFITIFRARTANDSALAVATKSRREIAVKALLKTWPDLPTRDARKVTPTDAQTWAESAARGYWIRRVPPRRPCPVVQRSNSSPCPPLARALAPCARGSATPRRRGLLPPAGEPHHAGIPRQPAAWRQPRL